MKNINYSGITNSTASIIRNICEKNNFYFDLLEDGKWLISKQDSKIGIFTDCEEALFFFMANSEPIIELTEQENNEAFEYLENQINEN